MNDFHIITSKIYELLKEEDYLKYTEFLPLTMSTFIEILSKIHNHRQNHGFALGFLIDIFCQIVLDAAFE